MNFKQIVEKAFDEWKNQGHCQEAKDLNDKIGKKYFDTALPQFFTGDLQASLVLVHLNPKRDEKDKDGKKLWGKKCKVSFEQYWDEHALFGKTHYGIKKPTHKSPFDLKQIRFLKPFGILPFIDEKSEKDKYHNLEVVCDKKLQLELVPFGSPDFNYSTIKIKNLKSFIEILLSTIFAYKREYIIFCGRVFHKILKEFIIEEKAHKIYLIKKDDSQTRLEYEVINIKLKYNDLEMTACIAPQFALQGCPIDKYGYAVKDLYGRFEEHPTIEFNEYYHLI